MFSGIAPSAAQATAEGAHGEQELPGKGHMGIEKQWKNMISSQSLVFLSQCGNDDLHKIIKVHTPHFLNSIRSCFRSNALLNSSAYTIEQNNGVTTFSTLKE